MSFRKGHSRIKLNEIDNPKHPLIRALVAKGYSDIELIFSPTFDPCRGWDLVSHGPWLGYTKKDALRYIEKMEPPRTR